MQTSLFPRLLRFCGLVILTFGLCVGQPSLYLFQNLTAEASDASQLVQQGVEAYQAHQYRDAIDHWQAALDTVPNDATADQATILENLAHAYQQLGQPTPALEHWQAVTALYTEQQAWGEVGRTLTEQAQTYSRLGQPFQAIGLLCGAEATQATAPSAVANAIDSLQCDANSAVALTQRSPDPATHIAALGSLGEAYRSIQNYDAALNALNAALALAPTSDNPTQPTLLHNSLGNTYRERAELNYQRAAISRRSASGDEAEFESLARSARNSALEQFQISRELAQVADLPALEIKALLGLISVESHIGNQAIVDGFRQEAIAQLNQLPPNQETAYLALQLTKQRTPLANTAGEALTTYTYKSSRSSCEDIRLDDNTWSLLQQADAIATAIGNNRLQAFTKGEIGHFYECQGQYTNALTWTQQAQFAAGQEQVLALDTLYLWQWQAGRIYKALDDVGKAIAFYAEAAANLNQLRDEILASNQTLQFDFRDAVAPVYRELAEIQLAQVSDTASGTALNAGTGRKSHKAAATVAQTTTQTDTEQGNIRNALGSIDSLQLAELQNYYGSDCIIPITDSRLDDLLNASGQTAADSTALISTIIFAEQTAVILTLPNQAPKLHFIQVPEPEFRQQIIGFRNSVENVSLASLGLAYDTDLAQTLYQQLIAPFAADLETNDIQTLVFVHDGLLRNVPMAALYDGEQYLVEKYAIAIAPSLQTPQIGTAEVAPQKALVLGLTESSKVDDVRLGSLPAVQNEAETVARLLPGSEILLNEQLTEAQISQAVRTNTYSVFHIATHGQFGTDPQNTFLVMGKRDDEDEDQDGIIEENQLLRLGELDTLIRQGVPRAGLLELIALSACQTASGDERSSLGLAGITIRAGAKSALASLWSVDDQATADLMTGFYQNWTTGKTKSEALRTAQIDILKSDQNKDHPYFWSAFVLTGDWQ